MEIRSRVFHRTALGLAAVACLMLVAAAPCIAGADAEALAKKVLQDTGVRGGLVVHFGCGNGELTAALGASEGYLVHGLDRDAANVKRARSLILSAGRYGVVSVDLCRGDRLPYADDLVNLFVSEDLGGLPMGEVLRALAPGGVAYVKSDGAWKKTTKPRPDEIDDWQHALCGADNNAVTQDSVVAPPYHLQWVAEPRNARHHERLASISVAVSSGGRLFYIADEAPAASILLPPNWALVARDAFSGIVLWKRPIRSWESHLRSFRSGPAALCRRLVAVEDRVYVTMKYRGLVAALDAATGRTLRTYESTECTSEILCREGVLYLVVDESDGRTEDGASVMAVNADTGEVLWKKTEARPLPVTLAIDAGSVFFLSQRGLICLDSKTGGELWLAKREAPPARPGWSAPTLVVQSGVVLCADRKSSAGPNVNQVTGKPMARWLVAEGLVGELTAYSADTGKQLWSCPCAEAYHSPPDVFVIDGLVWVGQSQSRTGPDFVAARDLRTGEVRRRISPDIAFQTTMPHHRCHRNRATSRYIVAGRTGVEFIDVNNGDAFRHHWVRGVCQYGVLPCNGLLYAPPHSCACFIEAKLTGFVALAPKKPDEKLPAEVTENDRLERGPAFDRITASASAADDQADWPTYRHDAARSGRTRTSVPARLAVLWRAKLGGELTAPVIAGKTAVVASADRHTIQALSAEDGKPFWTFTAGGRIDSAPTISGGAVVFGSADGWVYCLRAADGALAWRYRAAPADRRVVSFGQVESVWPVHGSVLVENGSVYCAAGRSSYLDGGIRLCRLDLKTGRKLQETNLYSRDAETGEQPDEPMMFEMPGALPDVLSSDGELVYMRRLGFDPDSLEQRDPHAHLYSPAGFLNGDWWHRTYWVFGGHFYSGYIGWYFAGRELPAGRLLSMDDKSIYGFSYKPNDYRGATGRQYHMFAADRGAGNPINPPDYRSANRDYPPGRSGKFKVEFKWTKDVPLLVRAMALAGDTLFVAGPPERALRSPSAFEGERGGLLGVMSAADGRTLAEYNLDSLPVFDAMAAANGRLYLCTQDGCLLCLGAGAEGKEGLSELAPLGPRPPRKPRQPGLVGYWRLDEATGAVAEDSSGLGNDAEILGEWVRGDFGACILTKHATAAVTVWDDESLHFGTSDFAVEFWVKLDGYDCRILGKEAFPRSWWVINVLPNGRSEMVLGQGTGKGDTVRAVSKTALSKQGWTHLAYVVDRRQREVRCYVNGAADGVTQIPQTLKGSLSIKGRCVMIPPGHKPFSGLFDELKIHSRAPSAAEIKASYESQKDNRTSADFRHAE